MDIGKDLQEAYEQGKKDAVRHGTWLKRKMYNRILDTEFNCMECSVCGEKINIDTFCENDYNYCPSCGSLNKIYLHEIREIAERDYDDIGVEEWEVVSNALMDILRSME